MKWTKIFRFLVLGTILVSPLGWTGCGGESEQEKIQEAANSLPANLFPAKVIRSDNPDGTLRIDLPTSLGGQVTTKITTRPEESLGQATREGNEIIFQFGPIIYDVPELALSGGIVLKPHTITPDPNRPNIMRVNLADGTVTREVGWILRGTNTLYDGQPTLDISGPGTSEVLELPKDIGGNRFTVRIKTGWDGSPTVQTMTVDGQDFTIGGPLHATSELFGEYIIDFNH